jgi:hypothetical protein
MTYTDRIPFGRTPRYVCDACDAWVPMERMRDARGCERIEADNGEVGFAAIAPASLDPPLEPTLYRCTRCGHEHVGPPALKTPT